MVVEDIRESSVAKRMSLCRDYIDGARAQRKKHGPKTLVLMEVGSFFEMYAVPNPKDEEFGEADMKEVTQLLDIQMTRKNKSVAASHTNPFMAGFPSFMLDKYLDALVASGYTVAVMEQRKKAVGTKAPAFSRSVTRIVSPGTYCPSTDQGCGSDGCGRYTAVMYLYGGVKAGAATSFGFACADFATGAVHVYEPAVRMQELDPKVMREDMYRVMSAFRPAEVVLHGSLGCNLPGAGDLISYLDLGYVPLVHDRTGLQQTSTGASFTRLEYQNAMLKKVWRQKCESMLTPLEVFDLELKPLATAALCALLQFAYEHGEHVPKALRPPQFTHDTQQSTLLLNYNSAIQLNLVSGPTDRASSKSPGKCFMSLFNKCVTPMGRREFRRRIMCPSTDSRVISVRYDAVHAWRPHVARARDVMSGMLDMSRLSRKLALAQCTASDLLALAKSARRALAVISMAGADRPDVSASSVAAFAERIEASLCEEQDGGAMPLVFKRGVCPAIDEAQDQIDTRLSWLKELVAHLNGRFAHGQEFYKLESTDKEGYYLWITQKRHGDASKVAGDPGDGPYPCPADLTRVSGSSVASGSIKLTHKTIQDANEAISAARQRMQELGAAALADMMSEVSASHLGDLETMADVMAEIDVAVTTGYLADRFGWVRPELDDAAEKAFVDARSVRHPIIQHVLDAIEYVPNDVQLGAQADGQDGMLLYGINASGKSSYMKAIGVCVVMAQAGLYVPAASWRMKPYRAVFTRITASDDLFAGKSTFTSEMLEMRNILKRVDADSLVIGDELCSGTESISAIAIVGAGIERLSAVRCSFVFATHLHELTKLDVVSHLTNVGVYHLDVAYDAATECLVYDRKLRAGPGDALYGIEVCRSLDLDDDFMRAAASIRKKILDLDAQLVRPKKSRYNAKVVLDACELCGQHMATETHHLAQQKDADVRGLIQGLFHKNRAHNLVGVCEACHRKLHDGGDDDVQGHSAKMQTSKGVRIVSRGTNGGL